MATSPTVVLILVAVIRIQLSLQQGVDKTLQEGSSGSNVVRAVVNKIQNAFGTDYQFLRRVAFVETRDGTEPGAYLYGGIWQVDESYFIDTKNITGLGNQSELIQAYKTVYEKFKIDWLSTKWSDLRIPLYSGIAARLLLITVPKSIPCDVPGQAAYWATYYSTSGTEEKFIQDVAVLANREKCRVNSDIMLVLDESGSIGASNFESVKKFILQFVDSLRIGPDDNQVGVITFSDVGRLRFGLDTYSNATLLKKAVQNITYSEGDTNIPDSLCHLLNVFSNNKTGARSENTVFRVAIVMTDGQSNKATNACGFVSVADAARNVHAALPPILVFAFGVGNGYKRPDVEAIASGDQYIAEASSFSFEQLLCVQSTQEEKICNTISTPVPINTTSSGVLEQREEIRWEFVTPIAGLSFTLDVQEGSVILYASTEITAPNEAFYFWKIEASVSAQQTINIIPSVNASSVPSVRQNNNTFVPVYTTLQGLNDKNIFTLRTSDQLKKADPEFGGTYVIIMITVPTVVAVCVVILLTVSTGVELYHSNKRRHSSLTYSRLETRT